MPRPLDRPLPWRSAPLLGAAAALAAGVWLDAALAPGALRWLDLGLLALALGLLAMAVTRGRLVSLQRLGLTAAAALALLALGGLRHADRTALPPDALATLAAEADDLPFATDVTVRGRIVGAVTQTERSVRFRLGVDSAGTAPLWPARGDAEVTLWHPRDPAAPRHPYPTLAPGDSVRLLGRLRPLPERRNPADFDYGAFLRRQGRQAVVSVTDSAGVVLLARAPTPGERLVTAARGHVRESLRATIARDDVRGVLEALLLADRSGIERETRDRFARMGLAHLLAVSGLHVLLVGMVLYAVLKPVLHRFGLRWRTVELARLGLTLALVGAYVAVVGGPASAVRALVMVALLIVGRAFERSSNALNALGAAALVLLLARPTALFDVGFQLSFAAVGGLVLLMPVLEPLAPKAWRIGAARRAASDLVLASAAATLGTGPVTLVHFGQVPLAGLVLNVVAIPMTAGALTSALLVVATAGWAPGLAASAAAAAELFTGIVLATGDLGDRWLGWTVVGGYVPVGWGLAALVAALLALAGWRRPRVRWRLSGAGLGCAMLAVWTPVLQGAHRPALDVLFFDVGQGDAVLLRLPSGRTLLVDAGPRDPYTDAGERVLLPHLQRFGIERLDAVVVTHPHADHLGGVPALLRAGRAARVLHNGQPFDSELLAETERLALARSVPYERLVAGDTLYLDPAVRLHVLHPGPEPGDSPNDASVVLLVVYGETRFLLTGDAEAEAEGALVARYGALLCADVVKVGHHGSRTSSTEPFVAAAACDRTRFAVVPVARRNRYNHPSADVLGAWRSAGAEVLLTAEEGAVWLRSDGTAVSRRAWR